MDVDVLIAKIALNDNGILYVKPINYSFPMIYRSAMGVHWDENKCCLFHNPPREWSVLRWYKQIVLAAKDEYGVTLKVCADTIYENIDAVMQKSIENGEFITAV